jgi:hypothetical protein
MEDTHGRDHRFPAGIPLTAGWAPQDRTVCRPMRASEVTWRSTLGGMLL